MYDMSRVPQRPQVTFHARLVGEPTPIADTNEAALYYRAGMNVLFQDPSVASAAFYWASRLNPGWADPYFARWFVLRNTKRRLPDTVRVRVDSLLLQAGIHDPFFDEQLALREYSVRVHAAFSDAQREINGAAEEENRRRLADGEPLIRASRIEIPHSWYLAFTERHFDSASHDLAREIQRHPDVLELYVYRAKAQYYLKQYDSVATTLTAAVGRVDAKDTSRALPVYFSREMFYYAIGFAEAEAHRDSAERVAFQHTVTENLGFYMAHLHLAGQATRRHDTVTAMNEARIAVQIRPSDPLAQLFLGYALLTAGHPDDASDPLRAAIADDPYFALPYFYLATAREAVHDTIGSRDAYSGFLGHAAQSDTLRKTARLAIVRLGGTS